MKNLRIGVMKRKINRPFGRGAFGIELEDIPNLNAVQDAEGLVRFCRKRGYINGQEIDIEAVIENHSQLQLLYADLGDKDAYIKRVDQEKFEIGVNKRHSTTRQRFSMAHELAHFLLHQDQIEDLKNGERIMYRDAERNPREFSANLFASESLMPEDAFREVYEEFHGNVMYMAREFGVSPEALKYRGQSLGYLSE